MVPKEAFQPAKSSGALHLLIDTSSLVRKSMRRQVASNSSNLPGATASAFGGVSRSMQSLSKLQDRKHADQRSASGWQARRDAAVQIRAASGDKAAAARADAESAKAYMAKLDRLVSHAVVLRDMPRVPPELSCMLLCGCRRPYERPSQVHRNIFLGDMDDARAVATLKSLGITHVVNMARSVPCYHPDEFLYTHIRIEDVETADIRASSKEAMRAIDEAVSRGTGVFVHCVAGVSRSCTVVIAWLVERERLTLREATSLVRRIRPIVSPNDGFRLVLAEHELDTRGVSSVADGKDPFWDFHPWTSRRRTVRKDEAVAGHCCSARAGAGCLGCLTAALCLEPPDG